MPVPQRGLSQDQEQLGSALLRDTRPFGQRVADFLKKRDHVAVILVMLAVAGMVIPAVVDLLFLLALILLVIAKAQHFTLPFRMPKRTHALDYNSPKPGGNKPGMASGIYYFGNDRQTNDELWFSNDDMRTHALIFGSTGSGKTEALVSIAYNALVQGSGFIYVDGKGDNSLFAKIFSMVRAMGREDDLLLINFMTGAKDIIGPQEKRLSNTMNPFATGSSSMLSNLITGLMDSSSQNSSGDMWKGRAIAFVEALMKVLVTARDAGYILLDANTIRNYFALEKLEEMMNRVLVRENQEPVSIAEFPSVVLEPINNYLLNLPGYIKEKKGKQSSQVYEQHGYITMQLTRVFSSLADTYGHIIRTNLPEVDLKDVVLNRRILVVLLPALEKSPDELANLGKIIIASLKTMMASGLGDEVEGKYSQVIERKPTNARNPYLCVLDEYGYYAVPGFAVVPAQARSLGFSVVFAGQDLPAFQKASKEEAASIGANTNIKICMKLEDPAETWEFFLKSAGESYVAHVGGFQADTQGLSGQYLDSKSAQIEKRARIDLLDLKEQREGEAHIFFKSRIVRAKMFYANPGPVAELKLNQFLKVGLPSDTKIAHLRAGAAALNNLDGELGLAGLGVLSDESQLISKLFKQQDGPHPLAKGIATLFAYAAHAQERSQEPQDPSASPMGPNFTIFTGRPPSAALKQVLTEAELATFSQPLLASELVSQFCLELERRLGKEGAAAQRLLSDLLKDLQTVTSYPPERVAGISAKSFREMALTVLAAMDLQH